MDKVGGIEALYQDIEDLSGVRDIEDYDVNTSSDPSYRTTRSGTRYNKTFDADDNINPQDSVIVENSPTSASSSSKAEERKRMINKLKAKISLLKAEEELEMLEEESIVDNHEQEFEEPQEQSSPSPSTPNQLDIVQQFITSQTQFMNKMIEQQQQNSLALTLPNSEVPVFHGDHIEYNGFIRAFENIIEAKTKDDNARLYYLVQYTSGEVKEVMRSCLPMKPTEGYAEARRLLKKRFGQNYRPPIKSEDGESFQKLSTALTTCKNTLQEIGYISKIESADSLRKIVNRLPYEVRRRWRTVADRITEQEDREIVLNDLVQFVDKEARITTHPVFGNLSIKDPVNVQDKRKTFQSKSSFYTQVNNQSEPAATYSSSGTGSTSTACLICNQRHHLLFCEKFKKLSLQERSNMVMQKGLCFNCLNHGHRAITCRNQSRCKVCQGRHATILHQHSSANQEATSYNKKASDRSSSANQQSGSTLNVKNGFSCTNTNSDQRLLTDLGVSGKKTTISLTTIEKENNVSQSRMISLQVYDLDEINLIELPMVLSRPSIPVSMSDVPTQEDIKRWPHLQGIYLPKVNAEVALLIGNDNIAALEPKEVRNSKDGGPYAVLTNLGWVINGPLGRENVNHRPKCNFIKQDQQLSQQFREFCDREFNDSIIDVNHEMSQEDQKALSIMKKSVQLKDNHYQVDLPWKINPPQLPENKILAEHRLNLLKRRFLADPYLFEKYSEFMENLLQKGYSEIIDPDTKSTIPNFYLPHHPVINLNKKPTKVRVVFDCSAKYHGTSLNDCLLQGPNLTNTLVGVITRFREEPIALLADIEAMFHQVQVPEDHRNALRYIWWKGNDLSKDPSTFRMRSHAFGLVSSPSICSFALLQTAYDDNISSQDIINCIQRNFYVDDFLKSTRTTDEAINIADGLRKSLSNGGFRLTKWVSNSQRVLESIPEPERAVVKDHRFEESQVERTLGIRWNVETDSFGFEISIQPRTATRRNILSLMSSIFDPLGIVGPCTLEAKRILQELCRLNYGWDTPIPPDIVPRWNKWLAELPKLAKLEIPRCIKPPDYGSVASYQLHHFSDASEIGYGAVSYIRMVDDKDRIHCSFLIGKSRLTPMKKITIPRLELSAATVSVRLDKMMRQELDLPIEKSVFWVDSTSVLKYIKNQTRRFHTFVANRVAIIREGTDPSNWYCVDTIQNPGDDSSRGLTASDLIKNQRWILGPGFLKLPESDWPKQIDSEDTLSLDDPEVKIEKKCNLIQENQLDTVNRIFNKFSSWFCLKRCIAYILRYKNNLKKACMNKMKGDNPLPNNRVKTKLQFQPLTVLELRSAEKEILKYVQKESFSEEIEALRQNQTVKVKKSSSIVKLDPVYMNDLIRVGGRLRHSSLSMNSKHPIILPKNHHINTLLIRHYHLLTGHSGREYVLSEIRRNYWILNANSAVRQLVSRCFDCRKRQAQPMQQKMADLPPERITADRPPFTCVGLDFFGPFLVKRGRSQLKRYGCIFTCLAVRAIHIEVAYSLDTDSFINALRRFIARRGSPKEIRCDNGTNFVGGNNELKASIEEWNQKQINDFLIQKDVNWIFNTPSASHHGGVWERCIRTVRKVLNALMKEQTLDDENLSTLMCEVEGIINGRPITTVSDDVNDLEPLSPNHILQLRSEVKLPPGVFVQQDLYSRKRWRQVQYMADLFWKRWKREYLPLLQQRHKWRNAKESLKVNDIVLLVDDNLPRSMWSLARIIEVLPGKDGLIRSVKLKTKTSVLERPVTKCVLLESSDD